MIVLQIVEQSHYRYVTQIILFKQHVCERSTRAVITKVAIDQLLYTPVAIGAFYFTLDTLEGHPLRLQETMTVLPRTHRKTLLQAYMIKWCCARK